MLDRTSSQLQVMDPTGHTNIAWNPGVPDEVKVAKQMFDDMTKLGYRAFAMEHGGGQGRPIKTFEPGLEKIIMIPQLVGG